MLVNDTVPVLPSLTGPLLENVADSGAPTVVLKDADPVAPPLSLTETVTVNVPAAPYAWIWLIAPWETALNVEVVASPQWTVTVQGPSLTCGSANEPRKKLSAL